MKLQLRYLTREISLHAYVNAFDGRPERAIREINGDGSVDGDDLHEIIRNLEPSGGES